MGNRSESDLRYAAPLFVRLRYVALCGAVAASCGFAAQANAASEATGYAQPNCIPEVQPSAGSAPQYAAYTSKASAILGGAPSAFEALKAAQGRQRVAAVPAVRASLSVPSTPRRDKFQADIVSEGLPTNLVFNKAQIERSVVSLQSIKIIEDPLFDLKSRFGYYKPAVLASKAKRRSRFSQKRECVKFNQNEAAQPVRSPIHARYSNDKPDIFGTVALSIRKTPLDSKWNKVQRARTMQRAVGPSISGVGAGANGKLSLINSVNKWVNRHVKFTDDIVQYRRNDYWASAAETLRSRRGDCEDYAIAKMQLLQAKGIRARDMFLVIAKDLIRRADHAVLVVKIDGRMLVLDNETDKIMDADAVRDYRPVLTYSGNRKWLHGYKPVRRPIRTASLSVGK